MPSWVIWLLAILPLLGWWTTGLFDLDEGFYAAVTGEMLRRGDFITPYYNGAPWFEKPILLYWISAPFISVFGEMVGPRLPSVLTTLALYAAVWSFARRSLGQFAADAALLMLSGSMFFAFFGRMMMTDLPLVLAQTLAFLCLYRSIEDGVKWRYAAAFWLGVSVLAKGPVGCALFLAVVGLLVWTQPESRAKLKGGWLLGLGILAAVVSVWYVPAYLANGDLFVQKFLIEQNVGRFTGGDKAHTKEGVDRLVYYIPFLILGTLPWTGRIFKGWPGRGDAPFLRYCAIWALVVLGFFTLSAAKLPHYVLPAVPPLALIAGAQFARAWEARGQHVMSLLAVRGPAIATLVVALVVNAGTVFYYRGVPWQGKHQVPPHREIHDLTRAVRDGGLPMAMFQMPRRQLDRGTRGSKLQETSHPSIVFYADRPVLAAETVVDLDREVDRQWVLTRSGRFSPEVLDELAGRGWGVTRVIVGEAGFFEARLLERLERPSPKPSGLGH